jgi:ABC-type branched-subunit amino acid transport system ATPase component
MGPSKRSTALISLSPKGNALPFWAPTGLARHQPFQQSPARCAQRAQSGLAAKISAAIARALLSKPRILRLDEPSLGLAPMIVAKIFEIVRDLKARGTTILLVEQNASAAIRVSDYVYVLNNGLISSHGAAANFGDGSDLMGELTGVHV